MNLFEIDFIYFSLQFWNMDLLFFILGLIDLIAGGILFTNQSLIVTLIGIVLLGKGILTIFKSLK